MNGFQKWWRDEGSAMRPLPNEDVEEFARRITAVAWANGAYCALSAQATERTGITPITSNLSQRDA